MNKSYFVLILTAIGFLGCSDDEKATIEVVDENREIAAYVRTIAIDNAQFIPGASSNVFETILEVKDEQDGGLLDAIDVYVLFKDNTLENGDDSKGERLLKSLSSDLFEIGPFGLPRTSLTISEQEVVNLLDLNAVNLSCKDQFLVRIDLKLTDGRSFTTGAASSKIIAFDDFWSSPFCYTINVVEAIDPEKFLGRYTMTAVSETILPPAFGDELVVDIFQGHSPNVREMRLKHRMSRPLANEQPRIFRFTVACDNTIMGKNLLASKIAFCGRDPSILIGPDIENGPADANDDAVFELWFVEGYLGFDGQCGFGTVPVRYRFSKQ